MKKYNKPVVVFLRFADLPAVGFHAKQGIIILFYR
jgi:hypothetical protein